ncbi:MAG: M24 family metallopeptidase [Acidimicrobiales bacterium]
MTAGGDLLQVDVDLPRMRKYRAARLTKGMDRLGLDALLLFGSGAVQYAAGADERASDAGRATHLRTAALYVSGDDQPHLFTAHREGAPPELDADHRHSPLYLESDQGVELMATAVADLCGSVPSRMAIDDLSGPLFRLAPEVLQGTELIDASRVLGPARIIKSAEELACLRWAQHLNEVAMVDVQKWARPGTRLTELTGCFLRRAFELGATANGIDPIWQVMADSRSKGPYTTTGDVAFPLVTSDRILVEGDVIWVDTGIHYHGYASDFGRTWIASFEPRPNRRQRDQYQRWRDVVDATLDQVRPGATGADLTAAARRAAGGSTPWLAHFYLIHGLGTESAEPPMFGTDLGEEHDASVDLEPGMVLVLEPVIWNDGDAGYRSEDTVAVTEDGWIPLSDHPYDPFGR